MGENNLQKIPTITKLSTIEVFLIKFGHTKKLSMIKYSKNKNRRYNKN